MAGVAVSFGDFGDIEIFPLEANNAGGRLAVESRLSLVRGIRRRFVMCGVLRKSTEYGYIYRTGIKIKRPSAWTMEIKRGTEYARRTA